MDCPRCGAQNETDVGSCLSCGAPMSEDESLPTIAQKPMAAPPKSTSPRLQQGAPPKQCPNCMTLNAATFKFCARCGTPLLATGAPASVPPAVKAAAPAVKPAAAKPAAAAPAAAPVSRPAPSAAAKPSPPPPAAKPGAAP